MNRTQELTTKLNEVINILENMGFHDLKIDIYNFSNTKLEAEKLMNSIDNDFISCASETTFWFRGGLNTKRSVNVVCFYDKEVQSA